MTELECKRNESSNTNILCYWVHPVSKKHLLTDQDIPLPSCQGSDFWRPSSIEFWHDGIELQATFYHNGMVESVAIL